MRYQSLLLALIFDPSRSSKVKPELVSRKPVAPTTKCSLGSSLVSVTVFVIFRVKILTVDLLTLNMLTPGSKFTKRGDDLLATQLQLALKGTGTPLQAPSK